MRFLFLALLFFSLPVFAQSTFSPIPAEQTNGTPTGLELRVTAYNGSTNGELEVEVRNPTNHTVDFSAKGLYFVPSGDPDHAPQRVGAVGPFQARTPNGWERKAQMNLPAGSVTAMKLDVYCIDSHRASPSSATGFRMAKDRVPRPIVESIDRDAVRAAKPMGGVAAPAAKSAVQSEVWKNRDKNWIRLDGEGHQEATKH